MRSLWKKTCPGGDYQTSSWCLTSSAASARLPPSHIPSWLWQTDSSINLKLTSPECWDALLPLITAAKARWNQSSLSPTELNRHASSCDQIKMTGKTIGSLNMGLFRYSTSAPFKWSWIRFPSVSKILSSPLSQRQSDHFPFSTERQLATMRDKTWSDLFISSFMLVLA